MAPNVYRTLGPVQVEIKAAWEDEWIVRPNVEPLRGSLGAGGIGEFQFRVRYGQLKHPLEEEISAHDYTQIAREWIRVKRSPYGDEDILFLGRIESDSRELYGPHLGTPSGVQLFTAYCGAGIMNKRMVSQSVVHTHDDGSDPQYELYDRLVGFNLRPNGRLLAWNRTAEKRDSGGFEHYVFDRDWWIDEWRVKDAIEYLVAEFLNGSGDPDVEPQWALTIPEGALEEPLDPVLFTGRQTVLDMFKTILNKHYGWAWAVLPTTTGYEIRIASMAATETTFGGITIPANPNSLNFETADPDLRIHIERTQVDTYGKIRVLGNHMVIVRSFRMEDGDLKQGWGYWDERDYLDNPDEREQERFKRLFQTYYPVEDYSSYWQPYHLPTINDDGTLDTETRGPLPATDSALLDYIPLYREFDYRNSPAVVPSGPQSFSDGLRSPILYMMAYNTNPPRMADAAAVSGGTIEIDEFQFGISCRVADPGIFAWSRLQKYEWADAWQFDTPPILDCETAIATVAFESPQRLRLVYEIEDAIDADGVWEIEVPDAHLWYMPRGTVHDVNGEFAIAVAEDVFLRNDVVKLERVMAGALVRYAAARSKAKISATGLHVWHQSMLYMCGAVADGTDANLIAAPITSVQWTFEGDFSTELGTGYSV